MKDTQIKDKRQGTNEAADDEFKKEENVTVNEKIRIKMLKEQ